MTTNKHFADVIEFEGEQFVSLEEFNDRIDDLSEEFYSVVTSLVTGSGPECISEWILKKMEEEY